MTPTAEQSAKGGAARTEAKAKALAALHASRSGRPVNPPPPKALASLRRHLRRRKGVVGARADDGLSITAAAVELGVSDRTLRRWLAGADRPHPHHHAAIERLAQSLQSLHAQS